MNAGITVRFEPRGAALDMFRSKGNEILMSGAAGTGKSVAALMKLHLACMHTPNVRALVVRKTHASLTASTLVTFRRKVAAEAIDAGHVRFYGGSAQEPAAFRYANGSVIVVGGLDRPSRMLSTEYDLAFIDEAIEVTEEDIDTLVTRLRNGVLSYQQIIMATNPGPPTHHLKQRADAGRCQILYSTHEDNPRMWQRGEWTDYGRDYLARLDSLTGARYQRMRWGKWVSAEGLVYDEWDESVHLVDALPPGSEVWDRWWGIDFGYSNPFVMLCFAEDPDGRLWLYRQMYMTKRLVEDHAKELRKLVFDKEGRWKEPPPRAIIADHDAEDRVTFERHFGQATRPAKKTVSDGIQAMQARLRLQKDGKPRLLVVRGSLVRLDRELAEAKKPTCFQEEITGYVWPTDVKPDKAEAPVKENDHAMDTARYVIAERDLGRRPQYRYFRY